MSHLRFGTGPVRGPNLIALANFIGCHQFQLLDHLDVLASAHPCGTFLLNSPYGPEEVWYRLPHAVREAISSKGLRIFVIDGDRVARETGMARRITTVMQSCLFALSGVLPRDEAIAAIRHSIIRSRRPIASVANGWWRRTLRLLMQRSRTCTRLRCRTRSPFHAPMGPYTPLVIGRWISRHDLGAWLQAPTG
ncbi:MAG: hypothetical protein EXR45_02845 [Chloroflexi bacterium]|nr:hypothetical protein [Chloroflexota bacterium]